MITRKQLWHTFYYSHNAAKEDFSTIDKSKLLVKELHRLKDQVDYIRDITVPVGKVLLKSFYLPPIILLAGMYFGFNSHALTIVMLMTISLVGIYVCNIMPRTITSAMELDKAIKRAADESVEYFGKENFSAVTVADYLNKVLEEEQKANQRTSEFINQIMNRIKDAAQDSGIGVDFAGDIPDDDDTENGKNNPM